MCWYIDLVVFYTLILLPFTLFSLSCERSELKIFYIRYVDDFTLFLDDGKFLSLVRIAIKDYLVRLRLNIHPIKSQLFATKHGANFLGFWIFPNHIRVRTENLGIRWVCYTRVQTCSGDVGDGIQKSTRVG